MPRPCAVESHARRYNNSLPTLFQMPRPCAVESHAHRYKSALPILIQMPRPCAVESHARRYKNLSLPDATALCRGASRSPLQKPLSSRCHSLAPWSLTLTATKTSLIQMPQPCAVESHARRYKKRCLDATALLLQQNEIRMRSVPHQCSYSHINLTNSTSHTAIASISDFGLMDADRTYR